MAWLLSSDCRHFRRRGRGAGTGTALVNGNDRHRCCSYSNAPNTYWDSSPRVCRGWVSARMHAGRFRGSEVPMAMRSSTKAIPPAMMHTKHTPITPHDTRHTVPGHRLRYMARTLCKRQKKHRPGGYRKRLRLAYSTRDHHASPPPDSQQSMLDTLWQTLPSMLTPPRTHW